jgi:hypothetical protein
LNLPQGYKPKPQAQQPTPGAPQQISPKIKPQGSLLAKNVIKATRGDKMASGPYIDDQWRDILSGRGFSPRSETLRVSLFGEEGEGVDAEVWRSKQTDAMIQITHDEEGDPVWRCYINGRFVEEGDDSGDLLSLLETSEPVEAVKEMPPAKDLGDTVPEFSDEDKASMRGLGITGTERKRPGRLW